MHSAWGFIRRRALASVRAPPAARVGASRADCHARRLVARWAASYEGCVSGPRRAAASCDVRETRVVLPDGGSVSAVVATPGKVAARGRAPLVILAHGAGADMRNAFLSAVHVGLAEAGYTSVKFNFPYTEAGRRAPDRAPTLEACYRAVLEAMTRALAPPWVVIGGKSMGGRMASHLAAAGAPVRGLLLLGYPLHPAGRPDALRADHLPAVCVPTLFVQGTRDPLCNLDLLRPILARLPDATLHTIPEGDHSFHAPRRTGRTDAATWTEIVAVCASWLAGL